MLKRKRRTKAEIRAEKNSVMNLFVSNRDGIQLVKLETKYKNIFMRMFPVETIPSLENFNQFKIDLDI